MDQEAYLKVMEKQRKTLIIPLPGDDATVLNQAFSSTTSDPANTKKTVRFDTVTVHEHPIIIGCNPAVTSGVPITIAWNSVSSRKIPFLEFEFDRRKERVANPAFLKQTKSERWNILQNLGFASDEMRLAEHEAQEIRCLRNLTYMEYTDDFSVLFADTGLATGGASPERIYIEAKASSKHEFAALLCLENACLIIHKHLDSVVQSLGQNDFRSRCWQIALTSKSPSTTTVELSGQLCQTSPK